MYDDSNQMHLQIVGDNITLDTPCVTFPTEGNEYLKSYTGPDRTGHTEDELIISEFTVTTSSNRFELPKLKFNTSYSVMYDGYIAHNNAIPYVGMQVYYRRKNSSTGITAGTGLTYGTMEIPLGTQQSFTYRGLSNEMVNLPVGEYVLAVQISYDWGLDRGDYSAPDNCHVGITDISNSNIVIYTSSSNENIVRIGANGMSMSFGRFAAIFGVSGSTNVIEIKGADANQNEVGLKINPSDGLKINIGTGWKSIKSTSLE